MKNIGIVSYFFVVVAIASAVVSNAASKLDEIDIVKVCSEFCPDAKNNAETHECVERKAKIRKTLKQTKCWEENEKYEKLIAESKSSHK